MATIRWCPIFPKWDIYQPLLMDSGDFWEVQSLDANSGCPNTLLLAPSASCAPWKVQCCNPPPQRDSSPVRTTPQKLSVSTFQQWHWGAPCSGCGRIHSRSCTSKLVQKWRVDSGSVMNSWSNLQYASPTRAFWKALTHRTRTIAALQPHQLFPDLHTKLDPFGQDECAEVVDPPLLSVFSEGQGAVVHGQSHKWRPLQLPCRAVPRHPETCWDVWLKHF